MHKQDGKFTIGRVNHDVDVKSVEAKPTGAMYCGHAAGKGPLVESCWYAILSDEL